MIGIPNLPHTHIERILFILGFVVLAGVLSFLYYVHQDFTLSRAETHMRGQFLLFQHYGEDSLPLPPLRMLNLRNGAEANIKDFEGRFLLLNLWATWCTPCLAELPAMQKLNLRYKNKGLEVVAISVQGDRPPEELEAFLKRHNIGSFAWYQDFHFDFQKALIFNALPTTWLIDPDGRILYQMTGTTNWYAPETIKFLDAAMKVY